MLDLDSAGSCEIFLPIYIGTKRGPECSYKYITFCSHELIDNAVKVSVYSSLQHICKIIQETDVIMFGERFKVGLILLVCGDKDG